MPGGGGVIYLVVLSAATELATVELEWLTSLEIRLGSPYLLSLLSPHTSVWARLVF